MVALEHRCANKGKPDSTEPLESLHVYIIGYVTQLNPKKDTIPYSTQLYKTPCHRADKQSLGHLKEALP